MARAKIAIEPGSRFGRWTVIGKQIITSSGQYCHPCRCDCGTEKLVRSNDLRQGLSQSCGCWGREKRRACKGTEEARQRMERVRAAKLTGRPSKRKKPRKLKPYKPKDISIFGYDEWMFRKL